MAVPTRPVIAEINRLKREKNAVILAHNYMTPEIFHCVGDFVGDSLALAREAARTDAKVIVQAGVHFMAETSKILSPEKTVLIPDHARGLLAGRLHHRRRCAPAAQKYPGLPVVTYVNTSAEVKAESDICCTSRQCRDGGGRHRARIRHRHRHHDPGQVSRPAMSPAKTGVKVITWEGACEVHERFTAAGNPRLSRRPSRHRRAGPSRMPAGSGGGSRFRRLDRGDDRLCRRAAARSGW